MLFWREPINQKTFLFQATQQINMEIVAESRVGCEETRWRQ